MHGLINQRTASDSTCTCCRLYEELTGVNDEIGDLEDRLAALKDKAESLGKKYVQAKKDSEKADREVQVLCCSSYTTASVKFGIFWHYTSE